MIEDQRIARAMKSALIWLTPPHALAAARARAGRGAVRLMDEALRALLSAGVVDNPNDPLAAAMLDLRQRIDAEAEALAAVTDLKSNPDEEKTHER